MRLLLLDFRLWSELIPDKILQNIRDQIVLPRLQTDVDQWNPLTDPVPIHSWRHPWLELLGSQLDVVYPTIKHKLASALKNWHPSDKSARLILLPYV